MSTVTASVPKCPRCARVGVRPLAREGDIQRFECAACAHTFHAPALPVIPPPVSSPMAVPQEPSPGYAHLPIAPPEASPALRQKCPKCLRPYQRGGFYYDKHVAGCSGVPYVEPVGRRAGAPPFPDRSSAAAPGSFASPPAFGPETAKAIRMSIDALLFKRQSLELEIQGIVATIKTLEGMLGGSEGTPASPGSL